MKPGQKYNLAGLNVILVRGFYAIDNERIDVALRKERNVSMRDKTEKLNGSDCYVIESECPSEKDTFWIDPRHGYSIAKAQARYKDRDLFISQENVCFRKIDDVWIVVEAVVKRIQKFRNGNFTDASRRDKLIEIKLNPDHERIGSFLPDDIVNGTTVLFRGNTWEKNYNHIRAATGHIKGSMRIGVKTYFNEQGQVVNYTWQDGRVVDANGQVITDFREKVSEGENNDAKH